MTSELEAFEEIMRLLALFFKKDQKKVATWLHASNPMFGGTAPASLIKAGRAHKVLKWIQAAGYEGGWLDEPHEEGK